MKSTIVLLVAFAILACATSTVSSESAAKSLVDKLVHAPVFGDFLKGMAEHLVTQDNNTPAAGTSTEPPKPAK
uniref:Salivary secreted peptide n=1 Tax=Anopheles funestus TaxID=62324 RepID=A0A182RG94_ANOFN